MPPRRDPIVYGFQPVRQLLRHRPQTVCRVAIAAAPGKRRLEIEKLCQRHQVPVEGADEKTLRTLVGAGAVHNGFVAEVDAASRDEARGGDRDLVVLVEDIQDPRNLGALLRVCECAGVGRVLVRDRGTAPLAATVSKTAAGALEHLEIERVTNTANELARLKADGYWVYGADAAGDTVWDVDLTGKVVLAIGGEEKGLRQRTRGLCDRLVALPLHGEVESLNLSTAASAILYEALRQRSS